MYKLTMPENVNADDKYFSTYLKENFPDSVGFTNGKNADVYVYFNSEPSQAEKDFLLSAYSALTDQDTTLYSISSLYENRAIDGAQLYNDIRASFAVLFQNGSLTIADAHFIELKLINVKSFLFSGDWATAQHEIDTLEIEGAYTSLIHKDIKTKIDVYVNDNY